MSEYTFQKLSEVAIAPDFTSANSQHIIVEDDGAIKRIPKDAIKTVIPITDNINADSTDTEVPSAKAVHTALSTYSPSTSIDRPKVYGVRKMISSTSPDLERIGDAVGLVAGVYYGEVENEVHNDFDNIYPWSHIRRCNLADDGKVLAYEGDINYSTNGYVWIKDTDYTGAEGTGIKIDYEFANPCEADISPTFKGQCYSDNINNSKEFIQYKAVPAQVMVEIPKFYQKYEQLDDGYEYWWVSESQLDGYRCSPLFENKDKIYISAYTASSVDEDGVTKLTSISGEFPTTNKTINDLRGLARTRGAGWELPNIAYYTDIIQHLILVEFATFNMSTIMSGYTNKRALSSKICFNSDETGTNKVTLITAYYFATGAEKLRACLCNHAYLQFRHNDSEGNTVLSTPRLITDVSDDVVEIPNFIGDYSAYGYEVTFSGDPIVYTTDETSTDKFSSVHLVASVSGSADFIPSSSGSIAPSSAIIWRGIENVYSNVQQAIDGIVAILATSEEAMAYATCDPTYYESITNATADSDHNLIFDQDTVKQGPMRFIGKQGYAKSLSYNEEIPWLRLPIKDSGTYSSNTGLTDAVFYDTAEFVPTILAFGGDYSNSINIGMFTYRGLLQDSASDVLGARIVFQ